MQFETACSAVSGYDRRMPNVLPAPSLRSCSPCPKCHSSDTEWLITNPPRGGCAHSCRSCNHAWKDEPAANVGPLVSRQISTRHEPTNSFTFVPLNGRP